MHRTEVGMAMSDRRRRQREERRLRILDGAQHLFHEQGCEGITMQDIADAAEVSKGSLYLQFRNKEDLVLALILKSFDGLEGILEVEVEKPGSALERLERLARAYMAYAIENGDTRDQVLRVAALLPDRGSGYGRVLRERIERLYGIAERVFDEGKKDGSLRRDVEAKALIRLFAAGIEAFCERLTKLRSLSIPGLSEDEESLGGGFIDLFIYFVSRGS
jgi:TetR/AcrR family transcriptional regulator